MAVKSLVAAMPQILQPLSFGRKSNGLLVALVAVQSQNIFQVEELLA